MESIVTVVVPSYNRAHLLKDTIPSYLQEGVRELILVDDCSTDNTTEVIYELQKEYPQIKYIRQLRNMRQQAAKNRGLEEVKTEWVYFGDDDSLLYPGTIKRLYNTCIEYKVDACGASAYYMEMNEETLTLDEYLDKHRVYTRNPKEIVNIKTLDANFSKSFDVPLEVPFCHACLIIKTEIAKKVKFDTLFTGNAYREETDFILQCAAQGVTFMYDSRGAQINLPSNMATGGARSKFAWKHRRDMIINNWKFLKKNHSFIKEKYYVPYSKYRMQLNFILGFFIRLFKRVFKRIEK